MIVQIEVIVKQLAAAGEHDKITAVINLLANEFTYSAQVNRRKVSSQVWKLGFYCIYIVVFYGFGETLR